MRAKKSHICCECSLDIFPGEQYEYFSGKSDGLFWTAKQHCHCAEMCRFINHKSNIVDECTYFGETLCILSEIGSESSLTLRQCFLSMAYGCNERFNLGSGI